MDQHSISKTYANAILELSDEKKIDIVEELNAFTELLNKNDDLETLLFSQVFSNHEKQDVLEAIFKKFSVGPIVKHTLYFLIAEGRINLFPFIYKDLVVLDDDRKGFLKGTIEGSDSTPNEALQKKIKNYLEGKLGKKVELDYVKSENLTAGYKVTVEDLQLDASLENQLDKFKESVLNK